MADELSPEELEKRFQAQLDGTEKRAYPQGRLGAGDDGLLAVKFAVDKVHKRIIIDFGKDLSWVALDAEQAIDLAQRLIFGAKKISDKPFSIEV